MDGIKTNKNTPDYAGRINKLRDEMASCHMDAILILKPENRNYLSGSKLDDCFLVIGQEKAYVLTDFRNIEEVTEKCPHLEPVTLTRDLTVEGFLKELDVKCLGIEEEYMTLSFYNQIYRYSGFAPCDGILKKLRAVKDEYEIQCIREAEHLGDRCFTHMLQFLKPGLTEREGAAEIRRFFLENGAEDLSFDTICLFGERTSMPHGSPSDRILQNGDLITMDFGCVLNSYCSDMTRTVFMGKPGELEKEIYHIVLEAQLAALEMLAEGVVCSNGDQAARAVIEKAGYGEHFGHGLGHGVGLEVHEAPTLNGRTDSKLEENMIVTIEPGVYIPGKCGVRIEDLAVVTSSGIINLVQSDKELIVL